MLVNFYNKTGFTLLELIVVIAIIGLLSTILYASFDVAKAQSRDKVRMATLKEVQLAIELYKAQTGKYPLRGCSITGDGEWTSPGPGNASWYNICEQYIVGLVPDYLPSLPKDPNQENENNKGIYYQTNTDASAYKLLFANTVESIFVESYDEPFARCPKKQATVACLTDLPENNIYAVYSAGAENW